MDDFWTYKLGVNNAWVAQHGRLLGGIIYNVFFRNSLPFFVIPLRLFLYLLTILFSLMLYFIFQYINDKPRINLIIVVFSMYNVGMLVSTAWLALATHLISSLIALIIFALVLFFNNTHSKKALIAAPILTVICLSIYQTSIFFVFVPFIYLLIVKGSLNVFVRSFWIKLMGVLFAGGVLYALLDFIYFKIFHLKAESRLSNSLNLTFSGIIKRLKDSDLALSSYYLGSFSKSEVNMVFTIMTVVILIGLSFWVWRSGGRVIHKLERLGYYIFGLMAVLIPVILQGFGDLRSKMVFTIFITVSFFLLVHHLFSKWESRRTFGLSIIMYAGLVVFTLGALNSMSSFIYPYSVEMEYMKQALDRNQSNKIIIVKTNDYPGSPDYFLTAPYLGHEPAVKLNSQYMAYNGGIFQMVDYLLKKQGKDPNNYTISEMDVQKYSLLQKSSYISNSIVVDMYSYEQKFKQLVSNSNLNTYRNPFFTNMKSDLLASYQDMKINPDHLVPEYSFTTPMVFSSKNNNSNKYQLIGWSQSEEWGTWTDGPVAEFILSASDKISGVLQMDLSIVHIIEKDAQIFVNNKFITDITFSEGKNTVNIPFNKEMNNDLIISIRFRNPVLSPKEKGINEDTRKLGIGIKEISFHNK